MPTNSLVRLAELFAHFPGIGPRQAKRFVYYLLTRDTRTLTELSKLIEELKGNVHHCKLCQRFFAGRKKEICDLCADSTRDQGTLMLVEKDVDFENIERTNLFSGLYFILGGSIPILEKEPEKRIRLKELKQRLEQGTIKEIILALSANPEGDNTAQYLAEFLKSATKSDLVKISRLGRGLSTGTELEYSDTETIRNALKNRS